MSDSDNLTKISNSNNLFNTSYSDDFLIDRLFSKLEGLNTKKLTIPNPVITKKNKKTFIENFGLICKSINRDVESVREYFEKNLAMGSGDITLSAGHVLTITGSHLEINLIKHLQDYVMTYVICTEKKCGSGNTELVKENRILWLVCKNCNCKKAINIKN